MIPAVRPSGGRGRPRTYASPTIREREKKRRQRSKALKHLRRSVGLERLAAAQFEFERPDLSHISLDAALADPYIGPDIGPILTNAARIQRALDAVRGPKAFLRKVEHFGGKTFVSRVLRKARRELNGLLAACTAGPCSKCGYALILEENAPFAAGDAVFVTCPRCGTVCYFGAAVTIPREQRRELGAVVSAPTDEEPPALALSRAAGGVRSVDQRGALGSGGSRATDRAYKADIEKVIGHKLTWQQYNHSFRPRAEDRA